MQFQFTFFKCSSLSTHCSYLYHKNSENLSQSVWPTQSWSCWICPLLHLALASSVYFVKNFVRLTSSVPRESLCQTTLPEGPQNWGWQQRLLSSRAASAWKYPGKGQEGVQERLSKSLVVTWLKSNNFIGKDWIIWIIHVLFIHLRYFFKNATKRYWYTSSSNSSF